MSLFAGAGFALAHFFGWDWAFPVGLLAGFLIAPLIPARGGCGVKPPAESEAPSPPRT